MQKCIKDTKSDVTGGNVKKSQNYWDQKKVEVIFSFRKCLLFRDKEVFNKCQSNERLCSWCLHYSSRSADLAAIKQEVELSLLEWGGDMSSFTYVSLLLLLLVMYLSLQYLPVEGILKDSEVADGEYIRYQFTFSNASITS